MQVSIENKDSEKNIVTAKVSVPSAEAVKAWRKAIAKIARTARINGFRRGHIPENILISHFYIDINREFQQEIFRNTIYKSMEEAKLAAVSRPSVTNVSGNYLGGEDYVYTYEVEVLPEFEALPLEGLKLDYVENAEITEEDIDNMINVLREQHAKMQVEDGRAFDSETFANINYKLTIGGKSVAEGGEGVIDLDGSRPESMIPTFIEKCFGRRAGETFTITCAFPEQYRSAECAGKEGTFEITVNSVSRKILPEVDGKFLTMFGYADKTMEEFRDGMRRTMGREAYFARIGRNRKTLYRALLEQYKGVFNAPSSLVEERLKSLKDNYVKSYNLDPKLVKDEMFKPQAEDAARLNIIFSVLNKKYPYDKTPEDYFNTYFDVYTAGFEDSEKIKNTMRTEDSENYKQVVSAAFDAYVIEDLVKRTGGEVRTLPFSEMISGRQ